MNYRRWHEADLMDYLDGRLSSEKQAALRADMAQDAALRLEIKQLEQTVAFTRAVPLRESPRNYLLTPTMVAEPNQAAARPTSRQRRWPTLLLRLTTAVTALAFVVTVGLNLLPMGLGVGGTTGKLASDQAVSISEETTLMVAEAATPMPLASVTPGVLGTPLLPTNEEAPNQAPAPMRMMQAEAEATPEPTPQAGQQGDVMVEELPPGMAPHPAGAESGGAWGVGGGTEDTPLPMESTQDLGSGYATEIPEVAEAEKSVVTETDGVEAAHAETHTPPLPTPPPSDETAPSPPVRPRRARGQRWWLSGILGVVTLLLGGATWWISRRTS
jgi:hypothetical protein